MQVEGSTEIFAPRTLFRGGRCVGPLSRPACQIIFSRCTLTGANVEILVRRQGEIEIEVFYAPVTARSRTNGCTVGLFICVHEPRCFCSIEFVHRQLASRCWSSVLAVFTVCRISTMPSQPAHGDLQGLAWCLTPPSTLTPKRLAAGGIYMTLQPRADTYRTSSYKLRCDTPRAGALQRRAVCLLQRRIR